MTNDSTSKVLEPHYTNGTPIKMIYTNHRGETSVRTILPISVFWGTTEWHPEPCWLLKAYDFDKKAHRDFALADATFSDLEQQLATAKQAGIDEGLEMAAVFIEEQNLEPVNLPFGAKLNLSPRAIAAQIRALKSEKSNG